MKTNMKIFTVLMLALTTMPCFADEDTQSEIVLDEVVVTAKAPEITRPNISVLARVNVADINIRKPQTKPLSESEIKRAQKKREKEYKQIQQEICNDETTGAKWKMGKCVCDDSRFQWDETEMECIIPADKPYKDACEKIEGGKWVTRGNTSTCVCPEKEEMWNRETKTCRVEDDEEEEIIEPVYSVYKSQKPFIEANTIKQQFIIYKLLTGEAKSENDTEFKEWKTACETVGKKNHVKTVKIVTDVNSETNVYRWHNCVAETCEDGYKPSGEWPVCSKDDANTNNFIAAVKTISDAFDGVVKSKKEELCKSQQQTGANKNDSNT